MSEKLVSPWDRMPELSAEELQRVYALSQDRKQRVTRLLSGGWAYFTSTIEIEDDKHHHLSGWARGGEVSEAVSKLFDRAWGKGIVETYSAVPGHRAQFLRMKQEPRGGNDLEDDIVPNA